MLESGLSGSVRGVPSNGHPYRDPRSHPAYLFRCSPLGVHLDRKTGVRTLWSSGKYWLRLNTPYR
jgi:hypothetical protein